MAEYANDVHADDDYDVPTKEVYVTIKLSSEAPLSRTQANDLRTAFLAGGWPNMRAAWAIIDQRSTLWLDGMPQPVRDGIIYQIVHRGPRMAPP
jgi:hypothetical protein